MKHMARTLGLVLLTLSLMFSTVSAAETTITYGDQLELIMQMIMSNYLDKDDISEDELFQAAMNGMFGILDPYSAYIAAQDAVSFSNSLNNTYVGIGVQLVKEGQYVVVTRVFAGGPADQGGVLVHDKIIKVDGKEVIGYSPSDVAGLILGEEGTPVTLTLDRSGFIFDLKLIRGTITINAVDVFDVKEATDLFSEEEASKIGYIKIESFTDNVDTELAGILETFKVQGKTHLLLDLRDNGGGYVNSAVGVCDLLVPAGPVLHFVNNQGGETIFESKNTSPDFEIVALINKNSASATEFVSAAIKESGVGTLVGETTFGKGVAQYLYTLADGSVVKLTQEAFYSRDYNAIHEIGVRPDVEVKVPSYVTKAAKYHLGDQYDEVYLVEEILSYLGYDVNTPDKKYDAKTLEAIKSFQKDQGLFSYGVCDFSTQDALNLAILSKVRNEDEQLEKAFEVMKAKLAQ